MHPTLCKLGSLEFHAYPTMLAIAFLVGTLGAVQDANQGPRGFAATPRCGLWAFLGGLIGAKVFWILQYSEARYLWRAFFIWEGGLVFYGGLLGGLTGMLLYARINGFPYGRGADVCAPYVALGEAITRIGCFLNGCCWGHVTMSTPWAVTFPRYSPAWDQQVNERLMDGAMARSLPVHPTQLYMALGLAVIFFLLRAWALRGPSFDGAVLLGYGFFYGLLRFTVEFFRGDSGHPALGMTVSQMISLAMAVLACLAYLALFVRFQGKKRGGNAGFLENSADAKD